MNCFFDKFENSIGVYRVAIDSVFSSVESGKPDSVVSDLTNDLVEYFKQYKDSVDYNDDFRTNALASIREAYDLAIAAINELGESDAFSFSKNQIAKDKALLNNSFVDGFNSLFSKAPTQLPPKTEEQPVSILRQHKSNIDSSSLAFQNLNASINNIRNFNDVMDNYFKGSDVVGSELKRQLAYKIFDMRLLSPLMINDATSTSTLNKSVKAYKNTLFSDMIAILDSKSRPVEALYDGLGNFSRSDYGDILTLVKKSFENQNGGKGITGEFLTSLHKSTDLKSTRLLKAYKAYVALKHFDSLIEDLSGGTVQVNLQLRNQESSDRSKYILASTNLMRTGYTDTEHINALDETTKLFQLFLETIPTLELNGKTRPDVPLNNTQVNFVMGKVNQELDLTEGTDSILRLMEDVLSNHTTGGNRNLNSTELSAIFTLYARIYRNSKSDAKIRKEGGKDLIAVLEKLDNDVEGIFHKDKSIYKTFNNYHTRGRDINFLDLITYNIIKVDPRNYSEVVWDAASNTYKSVNLTSKLTEGNRYTLWNTLGAKIFTTSGDTARDFMKHYKIEVPHNAFGAETEIHLILNGSKFIYNINGDLYIISTDAEGNETKTLVEDYNSDELGFSIPAINTSSQDVMSDPNYTTYQELIKNFESMTNQSLSSENYRLLDLFREEVDGRDNSGQHLKTLFTLMGNFSYLVNVNAKTINGNSNLTNSEARNKLSKYHTLGNIWDSRGQRFNIGFTKVGSQAVEVFAKVLDTFHQNNIKAVTKNTEGNFVPTFGLMAPINRWRNVVTDVLKGASDSTLYNNLFVRNVRGRGIPLIEFIDSRSGVRNKNNEIVSPSKLNTLELLKTNILQEYLYNKVYNNKFKVQPTNYADKSVHSLLNIDLNGDTNYWDPKTNEWVNVKYEALTTQQKIDTYYKTMKDYYVNFGNNIVVDYRAVLPQLPEAYFNRTKYLRAAVEAAGTFELSEDYLDSDVLAELNVYNSLLQSVQNIQLNPSNPDKSAGEIKSNLSATLANIGDIIHQVDELVLIDAFRKAGITWTEHAHFEKVRGYGLTTNRTLRHLVTKYSEQNVNDIKDIEIDFLRKLERERFTMDYMTGDLRESDLYNVANKETFKGKGLNNFKNTHNGRYRLYNKSLDAGDYEMNPILKEYLWDNLLVSRNFQLLTIGSPIGHPNKLGISATPDAILASQLVAQNKRMVVHQATVHPYMTNLVNGIGFKSERLFLRDPQSWVYNLTGESENIDSNDGSSIMTPLQANLYNASLLDQKVGYTHKSINGTMDSRTGVAGFTKHAGYTQTNENIRGNARVAKLINIMLGRKFTRVGNVQLTYLDITKDYRGEDINITDLVGEIAFIKHDDHTFLSGVTNVSDGTLVKLLNLTGYNPETNVYTAKYQLGLDSTNTVEVNVKIDTLHALWQVLGGSRSISKDLSNEEINPNSPLDGYAYSNTSWDALFEYTNRVGFINNKDVIAKHINSNDSAAIKILKQEYAKYVHSPKPLSFEAPTKDVIVDQKNIIQPLKLNHIGEITFLSGQKVGVQNSMSLEEVLASESEDQIHTTLISNIANGIQLSADHEVDESEVTEQTQIINVVSFNGETPEIRDKAFTAIASYIHNRLGDIINTVNSSTTPSKEIYSLVKKIIVKTFDDKDIDTLANSIVDRITMELQSGLESEFALPISAPELYNIANTAIANFFTKEGIRRKMAGIAAVAKPHAELIKFKQLPDGTTVSGEKFEVWRAENPDVEQFVTITANDINIGDTVMSPEGVSYHINDGSTYIDVRMRMKLTPENWAKDLFADRDLGSTYHKFHTNYGTFTYFDIPIVAMPNMLNDVKNAYNDYLKASKNRDKTISNFRQGLGEISPENDAIGKYSRLQKLILRYNNILAMVKSVQPDLANFESLILDGDNINYTSYSKSDKHLVDNLIKLTLSEVHNNKVIPRPFTIDEATDSHITVNRVEDIAGEVAMGYPHRSAFNIEKGKDLHDVDVDYFESKLNNNTLPKTMSHDAYLQNMNGDHLYVLFEGSDNHNNIIASGALEPVELNTVSEDGEIWEVDTYGEKLNKTGFTHIYSGRVDGIMANYVIVNSEDMVQRLTPMLMENDSKYSRLIFNYQSGAQNIKHANQLARTGLLKGNLETLDDLLRMTSENHVEYLQSINTALYTDEWLSDQNDYLTDLSLRRLSNDTNLKVNEARAILEEFAETQDFNLLLEYADLIALNINSSVVRQRKFVNNSKLSNDDLVSATLERIQNRQYDFIRTANAKRANALYASFKESLNVTTARVPAQYMQHFAAAKVVQFFNDEENTVFVSPKFQWTSGGDFDIDKVFVTYYTLGRNNLIAGWSTLWNGSNEDYLRESLRLPLPDPSKTYDSYSHDQNGITSNQLIKLNNYISSSRHIAKALDLIPSREDLTSVDDFATIVDILLKVQREGQITFNLDDSIDPRIADVLRGEVVDFINWYNTKSGNVKNAKQGTLNAIFTAVKDTITDVRNIAEAYAPSSFGDYAEEAAKSKKGETLSNVSYENPVDIFTAQVANMVGKEVIGITASTGLKSFSALSQAFSAIMESGKAPSTKSYSTYKLDVNNNLIESKGGGFHGLNYINNLPAYREYLTAEFSLKDYEIDTIVERMKRSGRVALNFSALLSAATDNAKELILSRINAGPDTVAFYLAAEIMGMDVPTTAAIMTSETTEAIINLTTRDVYSREGIGFDRAKKMLDGGILDSELYLDFHMAGNLTLALQATGVVDANELVFQEYLEQTGRKEKDFKIRPNLVETPYLYMTLFAKAAAKLNPKTLIKLVEELNSKPIRSIAHAKFIDRKSQVRRVSNDELAQGAFENEVPGADYEDYGHGDDYMGFQDEVQNQELADAAAYSDSQEMEGVSAPREQFGLGILFSRYLRDYVDLVANITVDKNVVAALTNMTMFKTDLEFLGRIMSVNQKIKTNLFDLKKYVEVFDQVVADYLPITAKSDTTDYDTINTIKSSVLDGTFEGVDFKSFSAKDQIGYKGAIDVLKVISDTPHIRTMLSLALAAYENSKMISFKSRAINNLLETLPKSVTGGNKNTGAINSFADDLTIVTTLGLLPDTHTTFRAKIDDVIDAGKALKAPVEFNIKTVDGRMKFINWFENTVIPELKRGKITVHDGDNLSYLISDDQLLDNEFIKQLTLDMRVDYLSKKPTKFYKLPINTINTDNASNRSKIENHKQHFGRLKHKYYNEHKLTDMFFLYNLIVNQGKVNANSFSPMLNYVMDLDSKDTMSTYYRLLGELDSKGVFPTTDNRNLALYHLGEVRSTIPKITHDTDLGRLPKVVSLNAWDPVQRQVIYRSYVLDSLKRRYDAISSTDSQINSKYINIYSVNEDIPQGMDGVRAAITRDVLNKLVINSIIKEVDC